MNLYRIIIKAFNWTQDDSELIDFDNCSFDEDSLEINKSCKIYRIGDEIKIDFINNDKNSSNKDNNKLNLNEFDENMKIGEIKLKDNKYYYIPNRKDDLSEITGEELFTWLIYKGNKYPMTKNKYKLREGDIIKMGRIWLIVRAIHIPQKEMERKNTNCLISYYSQVNESLNVNSDFKEDKDYQNLIEEDSSSDEEEENEKDNNSDYTKTNNNNKPSKKKDNKSKKKDKYYEQKMINIKKNIEKLKYDPKKIEKQKICRICYMAEANSLINPLIKPCKCSGSMKYIHLRCLLQWLKTKIQVDKSEYIENNLFTLYSSEKVECELCKQIFPHYIHHKGKLYNLLDLELNFEIQKNKKNKMNNLENYTDGDNYKKNKEKKDYANIKSDDSNSYIVLDTIPFDKSIPSYIYLAKFKDKKLKIGRGLDMNLIMNDLSISRNHCQLDLTDDGDVFLQDNNSKFGTLIMVQAKEIEILKGQTLTIQVGRTFFNICYKKYNDSIFSCCKAEVVDKRKNYESMNYRAIKIDKNSIILTESDSDESVRDEEENKKSENDYEKIIKNINNNKKISMLRISRTKKSIEKEEAETKVIQDIKMQEGNNEVQKDITNKLLIDKEQNIGKFVENKNVNDNDS